MNTFTKLITLSFLLIALVISSHAQVTRTDGFVDASQGRPGSIISEIPYVPDEYQGSFYIQDEWAKGNAILLSGDSIQNYPLKYDIEHQRLEILVEEKIKVLDRSELYAFDWVNKSQNSHQYFFNASDFKYLETLVVGMFEVLVDGNMLKLFSLKETKLREGNYNQQIDIGDRRPKVLQDESFYLWRDEIVFKLSNNKRKTLVHFRGKSKEVEAYAKENDFGFKKREDLVALVSYYLTL